MASLSDDLNLPNMSSLPNSTAGEGVELADADQMFMLIDGILSFEACLYYQVLPLSMEGSRLNLGMVDPNDTTAADYVRRLLSYINCSIVPRRIASDLHRSMLSDYLNRSVQQKTEQDTQSHNAHDGVDQVTAVETPSSAEASSPDAPAPPEPSSSEAESDELDPFSQPSPNGPSASDRTSQATLVLDSPQELPWEQAHPADEPNSPTDPFTPEAFPDTFIQNKTITQSAEAFGTKAPDAPIPLQDQSPEMQQSTVLPASESSVQVSDDEPAEPEQQKTAPAADLVSGSPKVLVAELLNWGATGAVDRLYFERRESNGQILYSNQGVLQSLFGELGISTFQGVMNELKHLAGLSLIPVQKPKQIDIEKSYQTQPLLLRLRFIPGTHGEEATLQLLQGAALKFYQQQQLSKLGRNTLELTQKIRQNTQAMHRFTQANTGLQATHQELLAALRQLLKEADEEIQAILSDSGHG